MTSKIGNLSKFSKISGFLSDDRYSSVQIRPLGEESQESTIVESVELKYNEADPNIHGVPLDYSFRRVYNLADLKCGTPREYRVGIPAKNAKGKYISSSLWVNYNNLADLNDIKALVNVSFSRPETIAWLDASFNDIETIPEELLELSNLKIFYLHGNKIKYFMEINKLRGLKHLRTLTLHGNPIETVDNYRTTVVSTLPQLINLDFSLVSK